jgi:Fe-S cluster assembly ATPase SufC
MWIFSRFRHPTEIAGVSVAHFISENMNRLGLSREFSLRAINICFSSGERKRREILQIFMLSA